MSAQSNAAPVIIKKKKKVTGGGGHHGGAWKVAYADFVTAMMAFFLLMWLLNATTEKQRKGVADYFSPTIPVNRISGGGDGDFGGESVFSERALPQTGTGATRRRPTAARQARGEMGLDETGRPTATETEGQGERAKQGDLSKVASTLLARGGESSVADATKQHIVTRVTDEGLIIELFDLEHARLFETGGDRPTGLLEDLATVVTQAVRLVQNPIAVEGHISARPVVVADSPVWDLSTARADRMRRLLLSRGVAADRMRRVTGHADRSPGVADPMDVRNNRLNVVLLRSDR